jgi:hypothetical protein
MSSLFLASLAFVAIVIGLVCLVVFFVLALMELLGRRK